MTVFGTYIADVVRSVLDGIASTDVVAGKLAKREAITVASLDHIYNNAGGAQGFVVDKAVDPAPVRHPQTTRKSLKRWAEKNNAVDFMVTTWEVTIVGMRSDPVVIVDIVPVLAGPCQPPLRGALVYRGGEGVSEKIGLTVAISEPNPTFTGGGVGKPKIENFFADQKITLPKGETNVLRLTAKAGEKFCQWRYRIDYVADGEKNSMVLSAPGDKPFEVTGPTTGFREGVVTYDWVVPSVVERSGCNDKILPKLSWNSYVKTWTSGPAGGPGCRN